MQRESSRRNDSCNSNNNLGGALIRSSCPYSDNGKNSSSHAAAGTE